MSNSSDVVILTLSGSAQAERDLEDMVVTCAWCRLAFHWDYGTGVSYAICQPCSEELLAGTDAIRKAERPENPYGPHDCPA